MRPSSRLPIAEMPLDQGGSPNPHAPPTEPLLITSGPMLCRLCTWTEAEWGRLPEARRPARRAHVPGLGWIGAVPVGCLN